MFKYQIYLQFLFDQWRIVLPSVITIIISTIMVVIVQIWKRKSKTTNAINKKRYKNINLFLAALKYLVSEHSTLTTPQQEEICKQKQNGLTFQTLMDSTKIAVQMYPVLNKDERWDEDPYLQKINAKSCLHPNLCKILYAFTYTTGETTNLYVVDEFVEGVSLKSLLEDTIQNRKPPLQESKAASIIKQCLKALECLHGKDYAHSTLKTSKIIINTDDSLKLIGLQSCKSLKDVRTLSAAEALRKKDLKDLRCVIQELKCSVQDPSKMFSDFVSFINKEDNIKTILKHAFLQIKAPYGPRRIN